MGRDRRAPVGTPRGFVEDRLAAGRDVVLEIDVVGASQIRDRVPGSVLIFVEPSMEELERRLRGRGTETEDRIRLRLETADGSSSSAVAVRSRDRERRPGTSIVAGRYYHRASRSA